MELDNCNPTFVSSKIRILQQEEQTATVRNEIRYLQGLLKSFKQ